MTKHHELLPLYRLTWEAFDRLRDEAERNSYRYEDPNTDFADVLAEHGITDYARPIEGAYIKGDITLEPPMRLPTTQRNRADRQALSFYESLVGINSQLASDPLLWAYLNHFHLHEYGIARWPVRNTTVTSNALRHWLTNRSQDIWESSIAGRTWWIAHTAIKAATHSGGVFTSEQALKHFSQNAEHYHHTMQYAVLRHPLLTAECVRVLLNEAKGINGSGYREIARELNHEAGARLLDALNRENLRQLVLRAADRQMHRPESVSQRKYLKGVQRLKVLSLGAGTQSTALALMAEQNWQGLEKPDLAIFADTGWEPPYVYKHLEWLKSQLSYEVVTVSAGNIRDNILNGVNPDGDRFLDIPAFLVNPNGTNAIAARQCTTHYKITPIHRYLRKRLNLSPGRRAPKDVQVEMWLGISSDEAIRVKPSRDEWITNRWPLLEMQMTRGNVYKWFHDRYPYRVLPRSACVGCPYRSDVEWKSLKENDPDSFDDAVMVDWALRNSPASRDAIRGRAYLHRTRQPLSKVDFSDTDDYESLMQEECEGMCGL